MVLRTAQTQFPGLVDAKYATQRLVFRAMRRPWEADFRGLALLDLAPDAQLVDVGANRGQSIDAFALVVPGRPVHAFEPNSLLAERLSARYGSWPNVTVESVALGDTAGEFILHVPVYNGYVFDGLASLEEAAARQWLERRVIRYDPAKFEIRHMSCRTRRLDDVGLSPALIKIDVQGFELPVVRGARETLQRHHPVLLIETPEDELADHLAELGYAPHAYRDGRLVKGCSGELNTYFL